MPMVIDSVVFLSSSPPGAAACSLSDMVMWWCMGIVLMSRAISLWKSFEFWREFLNSWNFEEGDLLSISLVGE